MKTAYGACMTKAKPLHPQWERFLKELSDKLSKPSAKIPSVRCLSSHTFSSIFTDIKRDLKLLSTFPSGVETLSLLTSMGLASPVPVEKLKKNAPSKEFYLIGISASHDTMADPLEILQAYKPSGVICFFSALSFYELTTQFPTHQHIATIVEPTFTTKTEQTRTSASQSSDASNNNKFGPPAFSYQGVPFYSPRRSRNTIPGIKNRNFNPKTNIKITSKEQTLLDTLHYPLHCGGPEVVFEAWEDQLSTLDEQALLALLDATGSTLLTRRLGTLFDFMNYKPRNELSLFLEKVKVETKRSKELAEISLLRGFHYSHINHNWKTFTP
jgi:hypothetical protein